MHAPFDANVGKLLTLIDEKNLFVMFIVQALPSEPSPTSPQLSYLRWNFIFGSSSSWLNIIKIVNLILMSSNEKHSPHNKNDSFRVDGSQGQGPQPSPRPNLPHLPPTNNNKSGKRTFSTPENSHFWRKVWVQWPGSHLQWSGSQKWAVVPRGRSSYHITLLGCSSYHITLLLTALTLYHCTLNHIHSCLCQILLCVCIFTLL